MGLLPRLLTALFLSALLLSPYARADYSTEDLARMALERTANFWNKALGTRYATIVTPTVEPITCNGSGPFQDTAVMCYGGPNAPDVVMYRADILSQQRRAAGNLVVSLTMAHEIGHRVALAMRYPVATAEGMGKELAADCLAGSYFRAMGVKREPMRDAYQFTDMVLNDPDSAALLRGYDAGPPAAGLRDCRNF